MHGVDFNETEQVRWLCEVLPKHLLDFDYPEQSMPGMQSCDYYTANSQFGWLDARMLFALLREVRPRRMVEIGSGFSSLLTADVNRRFLDGKLDFTCIEPYPREFLRSDIPGITRLIVERVQDVPLDIFERLEVGDVLFIDSSHVCKTGSDVNHIYFNILPRLRAGVLIHIHDIFFPYDYPKHWIIDLEFSWNEQYLVQALLMYSNGFRVEFSCAYVQAQFPDLAAQVLGGQLFGGGSLWVRKVRD